MMPRDVISAELGEHNATYPNGDLADDIIARLRQAGFAIVPQVATDAMQLAGHNVRSDPATGLPTSCGIDEIWAAMIAAAESEP